jgi:tetratricopeptide (TPR) repeat protein
MKVLVAAVLMLAAVSLHGEVVHLVDGTTLEGDLQRTSEGWIVTSTDGKATPVSFGQVKSIEMKKGANSGDSADARLASLRRATANRTDINEIIQRYQGFIAQNPGTQAAKDAGQELAQWQERRDKGLVKAGSQWVTPDQLAAMQSQTLEAAEKIRATIGAGKLAEASTALDRQLALNPQNPSLLYLKGVLCYRQSQLAPARNAFQAAAAALPEHAPTHNNIAVILWKQRSQMQALSEYDKAMQAGPPDQTILDNLTEAFHGLGPEHQKNDLTKRVVAHYQEQEAALEKQMEGKGLYRWGSLWLSEKDYAKIQAQEAAAKEKVDATKKEIDDVQARLIRINRDILDDRSIQQILANQTMQTDPISGRGYRLPLPQRYYDLERDVQSLLAEQSAKQKQLVDLQKLMAQQQQNFPVAKYTGLQKPFDADSMPGAKVKAATLPASAAPPTTAPTATPIAPTTPPPPVRRTGGADFSPTPPGAPAINGSPQ